MTSDTMTIITRRRARVADMTARGYPATAIANRLGIGRSQVYRDRSAWEADQSVRSEAWDTLQDTLKKLVGWEAAADAVSAVRGDTIEVNPTPLAATVGAEHLVRELDAIRVPWHCLSCGASGNRRVVTVLDTTEEGEGPWHIRVDPPACPRPECASV